MSVLAAIHQGFTAGPKTRAALHWPRQFNFLGIFIGGILFASVFVSLSWGASVPFPHNQCPRHLRAAQLPIQGFAMDCKAREGQGSISRGSLDAPVLIATEEGWVRLRKNCLCQRKYSPMALQG